jgi:DNA-binding SARP family transcriptional activator
MDQLLARLTEAQVAPGDPAAALETAARRVAHDPLSEAAHARLLALHLEAGDRDAALRAYETCRALLQRELGTGPSAELAALAQRALAPGQLR